MLNKTSKYAVRSLIEMASTSETVNSVNYLHKELEIPYKYLARVMKNLADANLVVAVQGKHGGYKLARPASEIFLYDILEVTQGKDFFQGCLLGLGKCSTNSPCCLHNRWATIRTQVIDVFKLTSLADVAASMQPTSLLSLENVQLSD